MTGISGIGLSGGNSALDFQAVAYSADKDAGIVVLIADLEIIRYILARNIFYIEHILRSGYFKEVFME